VHDLSRLRAVAPPTSDVSGAGREGGFERGASRSLRRQGSRRSQGRDRKLAARPHRRAAAARFRLGWTRDRSRGGDYRLLEIVEEEGARLRSLEHFMDENGTPAGRIAVELARPRALNSDFGPRRPPFARSQRVSSQRDRGPPQPRKARTTRIRSRYAEGADVAWIWIHSRRCCGVGLPSSCPGRGRPPRQAPDRSGRSAAAPTDPEVRPPGSPSNVRAWLAAGPGHARALQHVVREHLNFARGLRPRKALAPLRDRIARAEEQAEQLRQDLSQRDDQLKALRKDWEDCDPARVAGAPGAPRKRHDEH